MLQNLKQDEKRQQIGKLVPHMRLNHLPISCFLWILHICHQLLALLLPGLQTDDTSQVISQKGGGCSVGRTDKFQYRPIACSCIWKRPECTHHTGIPLLLLLALITRILWTHHDWPWLLSLIFVLTLSLLIFSPFSISEPKPWILTRIIKHVSTQLKLIRMPIFLVLRINTGRLLRVVKNMAKGRGNWLHTTQHKLTHS